MHCGESAADLRHRTPVERAGTTGSRAESRVVEKGATRVPAGYDGPQGSGFGCAARPSHARTSVSGQAIAVSRGGPRVATRPAAGKERDFERLGDILRSVA